MTSDWTITSCFDDLWLDQYVMLWWPLTGPLHHALMTSDWAITSCFDDLWLDHYVMLWWPLTGPFYNDVMRHLRTPFPIIPDQTLWEHLGIPGSGGPQKNVLCGVVYRRFINNDVLTLGFCLPELGLNHLRSVLPKFIVADRVSFSAPSGYSCTSSGLLAADVTDKTDFSFLFCWQVVLDCSFSMNHTCFE